jgi:hypothetical protein
LRRLPSEPWIDHLDGYKRKFPLSYKKQGGLRMQQVIDELFEVTEGKAIITTDVGQHQMWAAQFYKNDEPWKWISSGGAGTMGFGFTTARSAVPDARKLAAALTAAFDELVQKSAVAAIVTAEAKPLRRAAPPDRAPVKKPAARKAALRKPAKAAGSARRAAPKKRTAVQASAGKRTEVAPTPRRATAKSAARRTA